MQLRKILKFNGSVGLTLPKPFANALELHWKDYVEIFFISPDKIVIKRHGVNNRLKEEDVEQHF